MKNLLTVLCLLVMIFTPLSSREVNGVILITYELNGHKYVDVAADDAFNMVKDVAADGIESVIK